MHLRLLWRLISFCTPSLPRPTKTNLGNWTASFWNGEGPQHGQGNQFDRGSSDCLCAETVSARLDDSGFTLTFDLQGEQQPSEWNEQCDKYRKVIICFHHYKHLELLSVFMTCYKITPEFIIRKWPPPLYDTRMRSYEYFSACFLSQS